MISLAPSLTQCGRISTPCADMDFETYSQAGYELAFRDGKIVWEGGGISDVGAAAYAEHPSTEIKCLAYDLKDGTGSHLWAPGAPDPSDLLRCVSSGGIMAAWNCSFEWLIWHFVCHKRLGWPEMKITQMRDDMAKSYAYGGPGALADSGEFFASKSLKNPAGKRLIKKLCCPRNPTEKNPKLKLAFEDAVEDHVGLYGYCLQDIRVEAEISSMLPDLSPFERWVANVDMEINMRGVTIDRDGLNACIQAFESESARLTARLHQITNGLVASVESTRQMADWATLRGYPTESVDKDAISAALDAAKLPSDVREVFEIRKVLAQSSVKKLYSIRSRMNSDGRLRGLFAYMGAAKTGRWAGRGPQPQNLPADTVDDVDAAIAGLPSDPDPITTITRCLRGLFVAAPGHDLICSDFSAIEAVVLAELSGETWRQEVFRGHGKIYEESASRITGIPLEDFFEYKRVNGEHHPMRKKVGKIAELASGYGGGVAAWKRFGASEHIGSDAEIQEKITQWREQSPQIVAFWRGLERCAVQAVLNPGVRYSHRAIWYEKRGKVLLCGLPSGRTLHYHHPIAEATTTPWGAPSHSLVFTTFDKQKGGVIRERTYGGRLTENVVQAVARDIQAYSLLSLNEAEYSVVLHVHDEIVSEVPRGWGSVPEFEKIMSTMPEWAKDWPVRASGGWRGKRYRK